MTEGRVPYRVGVLPEVRSPEEGLRAAGNVARLAERQRCKHLVEVELQKLSEDDPGREVLEYLQYAISQGWYMPSQAPSGNG